jgi:protocatechuate 3,4-dioxygenase beta subunit
MKISLKCLSSLISFWLFSTTPMAFAQTPGPDQAVKLSLAATISGRVTYGPTGLSASNMKITAAGEHSSDGPHRGYAVTDSNGYFRIANLSPGSYEIEFDGDNVMAMPKTPPNWTATASHVSVKSGQNSAGVNLTLKHGIILSGKVTYSDTGLPADKILIRANGPDHPSGYDGEAICVTGDDGAYVLCLAEGRHDIFASTANGGTIQSFYARNVNLTNGETISIAFALNNTGSPMPVAGVVFGPDGKPVVGAKVVALGSPGYFNTATTDQSGRFTFDSLFPTDKIYAVSGPLITPNPVEVGTSTHVELRLAADAGVSISGLVKDNNGQPVSGAAVQLSRQNDDSNFGMEVDSTSTDKNGYYIFPAQLTGGKFSVSATCAGYDRPIQNSDVLPTTGNNEQAAPVIMSIADSFVAGEVVDPSGQPIVGAKISDYQSGRNETLTDANGRFYLSHVSEKLVVLQVLAPQDRQATVEEPSGKIDLVITAHSQQDDAEVTAKLLALVVADPTSHGDGTNAGVLLDKAERSAAANGKNILLVYGNSTAADYYQLHTFLVDPVVKPILDNYLVVQLIDINESGDQKSWENPGGLALYPNYSPNSQGVPFFVFMDASGKRICDSSHDGINIGMPVSPTEVDAFLTELTVAAPGITNAQSVSLRNGLRRAAAVVP